MGIQLTSLAKPGGVVQFVRGTASDTDNVLEVANGAGVTKFSVAGNGATSIGAASTTASLEVAAIAYNPGTVAVTGATVTGTGTEFTKTFAPGQSIITTTTSGIETREIQTIPSDTSMTTVSAFSGTNSAAAYTSSASGSQLVVLPNGGVRLGGSSANSSSVAQDLVLINPTRDVTGTQQFSTLRDATRYNQTVSATGTLNFIIGAMQLNATGSGSFGSIRGFNSSPTVLSTNTGNITTIFGFLSAPQVQAGATGTISNWVGYSFIGTNSSTTNTISTMTGVQISPTQAGGTLANYAGISIAAKPAAATNSALVLLGTTSVSAGNYAIHNSSTLDNYLAGRLGIGAVPASGYHLDLFAASAKLRVRDSGQGNGLEIDQQNSDGGNRIFAANNNYLALGTNNVEALRLSSSGAVLVNSTTHNGLDKLQVAGSASFTGPTKPGQYTLATLPSAAAYSAYNIEVADANGGAKTCRSDGTNWKILNTTTTVS